MTGSGLFDVGGRLALVTGSNRGLGNALARGLVEAGAHVVVHGRDAAAVATAPTSCARWARERSPRSRSTSQTRRR